MSTDDISYCSNPIVEKINILNKKKNGFYGYYVLINKAICHYWASHDNKKKKKTLDPAKRVSLRPSGGIRGLRRAAATERPEVGVSVTRPAVASSRRRAGSAADGLPTGPAARVPPSGVPETQGRLQGVGGAPKTRGRARIQWQPADAWTVGEARPPGMSGVLWDHRAGPADASGVQ